MAAGQGKFNLITVHDDEEELVIHAGSGAPSTAADAVPDPSIDTAPADASSAAPTAGGDESADPSTAAETQPEARVRSARQEELHRRAEELAQAEAGLEDPHAFSRMRTYVLAALALLIVAFIVYTVLMTNS